jgi:nickel-dependent lactate racemase
MTLKVPFGRGELAFEVPASWEVDVAEPEPAAPVSDLRAAVDAALQAPVNSPPLAELARGARRVCVVVTDLTRACPDRELLPGIAGQLRLAGVRDDQVILLVALGLHRPMTRSELAEKLGPQAVGRFTVIQHEAQNPDRLVDLGETSNGVPATVNRCAFESDLLIATGLVEPHQYAGFSGGFKTLAIGAGGEPTITVTHGPAYVEHPGVRLGKVDGNPFQVAVSEAGTRAGLRFIVNVIPGRDGWPVAVAAGEPQATFGRLVEEARRVFTVRVPRVYDVAIAGVGYPKDTNLYQASRAASYLVFGPKPVVRPGGFVIVPAGLDEGPGQGPGEQRFFRTMRDAPDVRAIIEEARTKGYKAGEQRAFVMAKVLEHCRVVVVGSRYPEVVRQAKMIPAETMAEAFDLVRAELGNRLSVLVVPHALLTVPVVGDAGG